jgi:uncharacterized protein (DUF1501 family)
MKARTMSITPPDRPPAPQTRREFLTRGLTYLGAASALPLIPVVPARAIATPVSRTAHRQDDNRILVVVELTGGNDGLNTVIPYRSELYYRYRPQLGIPRHDVLPLTDGVGLHPAATGLKFLYDAGRLAIVQGVGYPNPTRSHSASLDVWHTGDPDLRQPTGWLGRYFDAVIANVGGAHSSGDDKSRAAIAMSNEVPLALRGERFTAQTAGASSAHSYAMCGRAAPFGVQLRTIADMIGADVPARIYYVSMGGFDTHSAQLYRHGRLLQQFGDAMREFVGALQANGQLDRVLVMAFSEFGRLAQENPSGGTDHGEAGPVFLIGSRVNPGLHGPHPDLARLNRGALAYTCDFRSIYAAVLRDWLHARTNEALAPAFVPMNATKV